MATFTISAYQLMFADEQIEADTLQEAVKVFREKVRNKEFAWRPSDEDMEFTISEEDDTGNVISEKDSSTLGVSLRA